MPCYGPRTLKTWILRKVGRVVENTNPNKSRYSCLLNLKFGHETSSGNWNVHVQMIRPRVFLRELCRMQSYRDSVLLWSFSHKQLREKELTSDRHTHHFVHMTRSATWRWHIRRTIFVRALSQSLSNVTSQWVEQIASYNPIISNMHARTCTCLRRMNATMNVRIIAFVCLRFDAPVVSDVSIARWQLHTETCLLQRQLPHDSIARRWRRRHVTCF